MLTRRNFGLASLALAATAAGMRPPAATANEETMATTTKSPFEITKTPEEWRKILTPEQFQVLREHGTERAGPSPPDQNYAAGTHARAGWGRPWRERPRRRPPRPPPAATCRCFLPRPSSTAVRAGRAFTSRSTTPWGIR